MQTDSMPSLVDRWYDLNNPEVSIVVLNWNKAQLTIECLKSLFEHTQGSRYEVIVVDNGSRAEEFALLSEYKGPHSLLRLGVNRFFGEGNNLGAELAKGEFVMFMNNDVTVTPGWLLPLIEVFRDHPECGVAGPKFVYPHGMLQEAGALLDEDGDAVQIGKFQDPASPRFNRMRVVDYVSAACVILRKVHFDQVLGFDFIYEPAYYEDVDLCMKMGELSLKTFYVPDALIVHHENATTADPGNGLNLRGLVEINRGKFVRRWKTFLKLARHGHSRFGRHRSVARLRASDKQRATAAVFTAHRIDAGEATRHLFSILGALDTLGYSSSLLTPEKVSSVRIEQIGILTGIALPAIELVTTKERGTRAPFDVFIAMGNVADERIEPLGVTNHYWSSSPDAPKPGGIVGYQGLVVNSVKAAAAHAAGVNAFVIKPGLTLLSYGVKKSRKIIFSEGQFVSGDGSNRQDVMIRTFRRLIESGVPAELHLAGSLLPESTHREFFLLCETLAKDLPVHFHIDASRDELESLYGEAFVYWHAASSCKDTGVSESLGLSALEAMSAGAIPLIASDTSPVFAVADEFRFVGEDDLAARTKRLFAEPETALRDVRFGMQATAREFSAEALVAGLRALLQQASGATGSPVTSRYVT